MDFLSVSSKPPAIPPETRSCRSPLSAFLVRTIVESPMSCVFPVSSESGWRHGVVCDQKHVTPFLVGSQGASGTREWIGKLARLWYWFFAGISNWPLFGGTTMGSNAPGRQQRTAEDVGLYARLFGLSRGPPPCRRSPCHALESILLLRTPRQQRTMGEGIPLKTLNGFPSSSLAGGQVWARLPGGPKPHNGPSFFFPSDPPQALPSHPSDNLAKTR